MEPSGFPCNETKRTADVSDVVCEIHGRAFTHQIISDRNIRISVHDKSWVSSVLDVYILENLPDSYYPMCFIL